RGAARESPDGSFAARSSSAWRTPFMHSHANVMSPGRPESFRASANWAWRSARGYRARGSATTCSRVVKTSLSFDILTVYVPGRTRGPKAAPNDALAAGGTVGALRRMDHVTRESPRRLPLGTVPTSFPA